MSIRGGRARRRRHLAAGPRYETPAHPRVDGRCGAGADFTEGRAAFAEARAAKFAFSRADRAADTRADPKPFPTTASAHVTCLRDPPPVRRDPEHYASMT